MGRNENGGISGIRLGYHEGETRGITRATIGEGTINANTIEGALNRNIHNTSKITHHTETTASITLPTELLTQEGRAKLYENATHSSPAAVSEWIDANNGDKNPAPFIMPNPWDRKSKTGRGKPPL
jgi:hypothetical protein